MTEWPPASPADSARADSLGLVPYTQRVTTSEPIRPLAGSSTSVPRRGPAVGSNGTEDDVLERLARLGDLPAATNGTDGTATVAASSVDLGALPRIVEADPFVPSSSRPTLAVTAPVARTVPPPPHSPAAAGSVVVSPVSVPGSDTVLVRSTRPRTVGFRRPRPRVRRVTRVVRHVDTWSVFKVAVVFHAVLYLVCLVAGVLLWNVATATGTVDNIEQFFEQFGWESFEFNGGELYHNAWIAGLFVAVGLTGVAVLVATVFNLITDLVGGIRVSVLEEEVIARETKPVGDQNVREGAG